MPAIYFSEITYKEKLVDDTFTLTIDDPDLAAESRAGQFLHVKCGEARLLRRPISICSVRGSAIKIVFEVKGDGTRWLSLREVGQKLEVLGPLGNGFSIPDGKIITVGGGIGVPPMLFTAESASGEVTGIIGFRSSDRVLLKEEFSAVCQKLYITTDDGSLGLHGPATTPLNELLGNGGFSAVLACGPRVMLSAVAQLCKSYNVPCLVSLEERMGCGVGACLVCACATISDGTKSMSRVCLDGPVFDAAEVVW